jgi:glycerol uptake facilitator-like aquaporin
MSTRIAPKLLAEFIGTFAFVFIGAGAAAVVGDGVGLPGIAAIAFAHGLTIMAFAFAYGSVSGAHMNPAVTVGVLAAGAMRAGDAAAYIVSQLLGGITGALLLGPCWAVRRPASAPPRSRTISPLAPRPLRSLQLPAS